MIHSRRFPRVVEQMAAFLGGGVTFCVMYGTSRDDNISNGRQCKQRLRVNIKTRLVLTFSSRMVCMYLVYIQYVDIFIFYVC